MSLESQLQQLNVNLANLAQKIQANTDAGNRIIQTLNPPAQSAGKDEPSDPQPQEALPPTQATATVTEPSQPQNAGQAPASEPAKPKRNRRSKAQIEADALLAMQVKVDPDSAISAAREQGEANTPSPAEAGFPADPFADDADTDEVVAQAYTMADVREAAVKFREAKGLVEGRLLLAKFELGGLADLQPERYAEFIKACSA